MFQKLMLIALIIVIAVPSVQADRRKYAWAYQTHIIAPDATEFEFYQTGKQNSGKSDEWEYRFEIEQGISPKFDFSVYQFFTQTEGSPIKWDAFQFRGRYRFGLAGEVPFDPVFYIEYKRKLENKSSQNKIETKLLVGKDFNKLNISINPVHEYLWADGYASYQELGLDFGLSYAPTFKFSFGFESVSRQYFYSDNSLDNKFKSSIGPTISYATGHTYYTFGLLFGLNDKSDDTQFRLLMGVGL